MTPPASVPQAGGLPESWRVRLPSFEGPLDLLLQLIKLNKLEIADIPVALICDQFHEYLELMEVLNLDVAGEFIYMAAYLVHLKSKMLLPRQKSAKGGEEDPRQDLVERLLEYRRIKEAASTLAEVDSLRRGMWPRKSNELQRIAKAEGEEWDLSELSLFDLLKTLKTVLDRFERENPEPLLMDAEVFSVRDQIQRLIRRLEAGKPIDLFDDLRTLSGRREAVAAFLAVLEMVKMALLHLHVTQKGVLLHRSSRELVKEELEAIQA
jgi:segregation and condensation protein A